MRTMEGRWKENKSEGIRPKKVESIEGEEGEGQMEKEGECVATW